MAPLLINDTLCRLVQRILRYASLDVALQREHVPYLFDTCSNAGAAATFIAHHFPECKNSVTWCLHLTRPRIRFKSNGERGSAGMMILSIGDEIYELPANVTF